MIASHARISPLSTPLLGDQTYGVELVLDLFGCDPAMLSSADRLAQWAQQLCQLIDMKAYGDPFTARFGLAEDKTAGYSLVQLIETSSITVHVAESWRAAMVNVFSCKTFDPEAATIFTVDFFKGVCVRRTLLRRGIKPGRLLVKVG